LITDASTYYYAGTHDTSPDLMWYNGLEPFTDVFQGRFDGLRRDDVQIIFRALPLLSGAYVCRPDETPSDIIGGMPT
jgi:hypothetical protein